VDTLGHPRAVVKPDRGSRTVAAGAIEHNLALVTGDPVLRGYPVRTLWA
jgi:PIN domain nuclease of toxin-antitoxin system